MAELFHQNYSPVAGSILLSALVASLPPLLLALMLAYWRFAPWKSAIAGATSAFLLAWLVWGMPLSLTIAAFTHGMAYGLWPICWIGYGLERQESEAGLVKVSHEGASAMTVEPLPVLICGIVVSLLLLAPVLFSS